MRSRNLSRSILSGLLYKYYETEIGRLRKEQGDSSDLQITHTWQRFHPLILFLHRMGERREKSIDTRERERAQKHNVPLLYTFTGTHHRVDIQRSAKKYANLAKQDPARARQNR